VRYVVVDQPWLALALAEAGGVSARARSFELSMIEKPSGIVLSRSRGARAQVWSVAIERRFLLLDHTHITNTDVALVPSQGSELRRGWG